MASGKRLTFQEALELIPLPSQGHSRRYSSTRAAFLPASDIPLTEDLVGPGKPLALWPTAAFGGHVYAQAGLAVCRALQELDDGQTEGAKGRLKKLGLHVCHGIGPARHRRAKPLGGNITSDMMYHRLSTATSHPLDALTDHLSTK